jgi:hypothetical protein
VQEIRMSRWYPIANGILWAAAIIASAVVGAPVVLSAILLPALAVISLLLTRARFDKGNPISKVAT